MGQKDAPLDELGEAYPDIESTVLEGLAERFEKVVALRRSGDTSDAEAELRAILAVEPRLAEPRLELAHLLAERDDFEHAEDQAKAGIDVLRAGGQWTLDIDPDVLLAYALNLAGEIILRSLEASDDDDLSDVAVREIKRRWLEARAFFEEAHELDPNNEDAAINYTGMRL